MRRADSGLSSIDLHIAATLAGYPIFDVTRIKSINRTDPRHFVSGIQRSRRERRQQRKNLLGGVDFRDAHSSFI